MKKEYKAPQQIATEVRVASGLVCGWSYASHCGKDVISTR